MSLKLSTQAFPPGELIPEKHSKKGGNTSPPLSWSDVPKGTKSLALIMDDPDAPSGIFVHWLVYAIPPETTGMPENFPKNEMLPDGIRQGANGFEEIGYGGPQPPSGTHRYFFHLFALDTELDLESAAERNQLERAMRGHVIEKAQMFGIYRQPKSGSQAA